MITLSEAWAICRRLDEAVNLEGDRTLRLAIALEQPTITPEEAANRTRRNRQ